MAEWSFTMDILQMAEMWCKYLWAFRKCLISNDTESREGGGGKVEKTFGYQKKINPMLLYFLYNHARKIFFRNFQSLNAVLVSSGNEKIHCWKQFKSLFWFKANPLNYTFYVNIVQCAICSTSFLEEQR